MQRTINLERTVKVAYEAAAAVIREQGVGVVCDDPATGTLVVHADLAGFDVAREVRVTVGDVERVDVHAVQLPISWEASHRPGRFPTFEGVLELSSMADHPATSQVALVGTVTPPLGPIGAIGEAVGGRAIGDTVLEHVLDQTIERLRAAVTDRVRDAAAGLGPSHLSRPRFVAD